MLTAAYHEKQDPRKPGALMALPLHCPMQMKSSVTWQGRLWVLGFSCDFLWPGSATERSTQMGWISSEVSSVTWALFCSVHLLKVWLKVHSGFHPFRGCSEMMGVGSCCRLSMGEGQGCFFKCWQHCCPDKCGVQLGWKNLAKSLTLHLKCRHKCLWQCYLE